MAETVRSFLTSNGFNEIVVAELEEKLSVRTLDDLSCLNAENLAGLTSLKALQVKKLISLLATRTRGGAGRQVDLELTNTKDGGGGGRGILVFFHSTGHEGNCSQCERGIVVVVGGEGGE